MLAARFTNRLKKDIKLLKKRGYQREKMQEVIDHICLHGDAPILTRPHNLRGEWTGYRECHIAPDWLLIFKVFDDYVEFYASGSHQDLFKKY